MFEGLRTEDTGNYAYFVIPRTLVTDSRFKQVSCAAKMLYALMLDRARLSRKNGWVDEGG